MNVVALHPVSRPLPPRRALPARPGIGERVYVMPALDHPAHARVVGVTREAAPRYDVVTDAGKRIDGLPADRVKALR